MTMHFIYILNFCTWKYQIENSRDKNFLNVRTKVTERLAHSEIILKDN